MSANPDKHPLSRQSSSMKGAAIIQFASKYSSIMVQLVVTALLSRLVTPEEYGLMAIVVVFMAFFQMFTDMGISVAIVQFRDLEERDFGALFALSLLLGAVLAGLFCLISLPISWLYGYGELVGLCCAASPMLLFSCANMVPNGLMLRERRFAAIGARLVVSNLVAGGIAIALAWIGWGAYALVSQIVLAALFVVVWNLVARPVRKINVHWADPLKKVFSYSAYQFGFSFLNYFARNLDNLVMGKMLGSQALAYYDKAYKLTTYPMSALSSVVGSVIQPFMAEHQDEPERLRVCWWRVTKLLSLAGAPIAAILFCCAQEVTLLLYGDQWGNSVPLLQVLSVSLYAQIVNNPSGAFFQSAGRTDSMFRCGVITTLMTVTGLFLGLVLDGLLGAAIGVSLAYCAHIIAVYVFLLRDVLGVGFHDLVAFLPELGAAALACVVCFIVSPLLQGVGFTAFGIVKLAIVIAVISAIYALTGQLSTLRGFLLGKR